MQLGIFAYTFVRPTVEEVFDAVRAHDMAHTEWNYVAIGQQEVPDQIDPAFAERVRGAAAERGISVDSIAGYTNLVDPDPERRRAGLQRLCGLIRSARAHGAGKVALCTGSRAADSMWRWHDGNDDADAWTDLLASLGECIEVAEEADVTLVFEPEVNNVVHTARKARRLLDELRSPCLKGGVRRRQYLPPGRAGPAAGDAHRGDRPARRRHRARACQGHRGGRRRRALGGRYRQA